MKSKKDKKNKEITEYAFSDKRTREKVEKHIHDINDTISDQDIKNVKVPGVDSPSQPESRDKNVLEGENIKENIENDPREKDQMITPWDILDK